MKLTKNRLKQLIEEELDEAPGGVGRMAGKAAGKFLADRPMGSAQGPDYQALQDQLQMEGGSTLESMHAVLIALLGHLAGAAGQPAPPNPPGSHPQDI